MNIDEQFTSLMETLNTSPLFPWGSPPTLWGLADTSDKQGFIALPVIGVPDVSMLGPIAVAWAEGVRENAPVDWIVLIEETDRPEGHCREVSASSRDADFRVFRYYQADRRLAEVEDTLHGETPGMAVLRLIGSSIWPEVNA